MAAESILEHKTPNSGIMLLLCGSMWVWGKRVGDHRDVCSHAEKNGAPAVRPSAKAVLCCFITAERSDGKTLGSSHHLVTKDENAVPFSAILYFASKHKYFDNHEKTKS